MTFCRSSRRNKMVGLGVERGSRSWDRCPASDDHFESGGRGAG